MSARRTLVLVPGLLCDETVWRPQVDALSDIADVAVPVLSDRSSITEMAEGVLDAVDGAFALAGHSLGGRIALEAVRLAPERIERLALLDTGVGARKPTEEASRMALVALGHEKGMAAVADAWLPPMVHEPLRADPVLMGALRGMVERATPESFERQQRALLERPDALGVLPTIECPTLVLVGREDAWSPVAQHEALAANIKGARLVVVEGAGHMSTVEQPAAVSEALRAWLLDAA